MRLLFLDVDGVLNGHEKNDAGYCGIRLDCANRLNRVFDETGCELVITSAWRYLIHSGSMTTRGFENLLLTHGVRAYERIVGLTRPDSCPYEDRVVQILEWMQGKTCEWAVVDDLPLNLGEHQHRFVRTDGTVGLTDADAERLIRLLMA